MREHVRHCRQDLFAETVKSVGRTAVPNPQRRAEEEVDVAALGMGCAGAERLGEGEDAEPPGHVVGEGRCEPPHPVAEEVLGRGVVHREVVDELADGLFGRSTPEAVMELDFDRGGEDR